MENEWVENLRNWASSAPLISKVWIFGSRVKGTHKETSDLDVAIELDVEDENKKILAWISNADIWRAELTNIFETTPVVDLQVVVDDDEIVLPAVLDHGILIYPLNAMGNSKEKPHGKL